MKAMVDPDLCTGCELCVSTCPEVFEMDGDIAKVIVDAVPEDSEDCARESADDCPAEAIKIDE
jgi:ferredoxin